MDVTAGNAISTGVVAGGGVVVQPPGVIITEGGDRTFGNGTTIVETGAKCEGREFRPEGRPPVVAPDPLTLWIGETGKLGSVRLDPGGGQPSIPVEYKVTAPEGQTMVKVEGETIRGLAKGDSQLTVTATTRRFRAFRPAWRCTWATPTN